MLIWQINRYIILFLWKNDHEVMGNWLSKKYCKDNLFIEKRWTVYTGPLIGYVSPPELSLLNMQLYHLRKKLPTCVSLSVYRTIPSLRAGWMAPGSWPGPMAGLCPTLAGPALALSCSVSQGLNPEGRISQAFFTWPMVGSSGRQKDRRKEKQEYFSLLYYNSVSTSSCIYPASTGQV